MPSTSVNKPKMHEISRNSAPPALPTATGTEQVLQNGSAHEHSAGSAPISDDSKRPGASHALPVYLHAAAAATGSAYAPSQPAQEREQQQAGPPAEHSSTAEGSGSCQKQNRSAGSSRFTPAQQAVAAALMLVLKRAAKYGRDTALAAKRTLISNNPDTQPLLEMLPDDELVPTMQQIEQEAPGQLLESLTRLTKQCEESSVLPLELFTRSMQCTTRKAGVQKICVSTSVHAKQPGKDQPGIVLPDSWRPACMRDLQQLGVQQSLADLVVTYVEVLAQQQSEGDETAELDVNHMLPGTNAALAETLHRNLSLSHVLDELVPSFTAALQSYQIRAGQRGQSFKHMVLLEAAVQGWSFATGQAKKLLRAMIAAEPSEHTTGPFFSGDACHATSCAATEVAPEQVVKGPAQVPLEELTPPHDMPIFNWVTESMDLSDRGGILERALNGELQRPKALSTELFPGISEELYCAADNENASMRPALVRSAARHVEGWVQVWMSGCKKCALDLPQILNAEVERLGYKSSELPEAICSAIQDISTRVADLNTAKAVLCHRANTEVLAAVHDICKAGKGGTSEYWCWKALTQLRDLIIYHAKDAEALNALDALLTDPLMSQMELWKWEPHITRRQRLVMMGRNLKEVVQNHAMAALTQGRTLRAHLEDIACYTLNGRGAAQSDVAHLIDILADRVGTEEVPPSVAWRRVALQDPDIARVMGGAIMIAATRKRATYTALRRVLPGLPDLVSSGDRFAAASTLFHAATLVHWQILVHMHIASVQKLAFHTYMGELLNENGVDTLSETEQTLCEDICRVASAIRAAKGKVSTAVAKAMHISMCVKNIMRGNSAAPADRFLVLLDRVMSTCAQRRASSSIAEAIRQALPGVVEGLLQQHKWPHGFDEDREWLGEATEAIRDITARHVKQARVSGTPLDEHMRNVLAVPGLEVMEAEYLVSMFMEFWVGQVKAAYHPAAEGNGPTSSKGSAASSADSSAGAVKLLSGAEAVDAALDGNHNAGEPLELSHQGNDMEPGAAADIVDTTSGEELATKADEVEPGQGGQGAAEPQNGLSKTKKAKKKKVRKARQRAARAEPATQTDEGERNSGVDTETAEGVASTTKREQAAEAQAAQPLPKTGQVINGYMSAVADYLLTPEVPASYNDTTVSSKSAPLSPQPSLQSPSGVSHEQLDSDLPSAAAQTAEAPTPPAQMQEPWQEGGTAQRKPLSQQAPPKAGKLKAQKQGRGAPAQEGPAVSPFALKEQQAASQEHQHSPLKMADRPPHAQPVNTAAEHVAVQLPSKGSAPQQSSEQQGPDSLQSSVSGAIFSSMQHEATQTHADSTTPDLSRMAPQQKPPTGLPSVTLSDEQTPAAFSDEQRRDQSDNSLCIDLLGGGS